MYSSNFHGSKELIVLENQVCYWWPNEISFGFTGVLTFQKYLVFAHFHDPAQLQRQYLHLHAQCDALHIFTNPKHFDPEKCLTHQIFDKFVSHIVAVMSRSKQLLQMKIVLKICDRRNSLKHTSDMLILSCRQCTYSIHNFSCLFTMELNVRAKNSL